VTNNLKVLNEQIDAKTIPIDNALDENSTNPVQNKAIVEELNKLSSKIEEGGSNFSGEYSDIKNAPDIEDDASGNLTVIDSNGNIIFDVDDQGINTTNVCINGENAATKTYVDEAISNIDMSNADIDLSNYYDKASAETMVETKIETLKKALSESLESDSIEFLLIDNTGNIIARIDNEGLQTTMIKTNGIILNDTDVVNEFDIIEKETSKISSRITAIENRKAETWTFYMGDGTIVNKRVVCD
jgi:hypothetical protein